MTIRALATPWASPGDRQFSSPTSFMLKLALGEAPELDSGGARGQRGR